MMQEIIPYTTWTHSALIYPFSFPLDMQIGLQHARSQQVEFMSANEFLSKTFSSNNIRFSSKHIQVHRPFRRDTHRRIIHEAKYIETLYTRI